MPRCPAAFRRPRAALPPRGTSRWSVRGRAKDSARISAPARLVRRYGAEAPFVARHRGTEAPDAAAGVTAQELTWGVDVEGALDVDDLLDRRTRLGLVAADRESSRGGGRGARFGPVSPPVARVMQVDWKNLPADQGSVETVATNGLEYRVVDTSDSAVFDPYLQAEMRGFLSQEYTAEQLGSGTRRIGFRRFAGVYDAGSFDASAPSARSTRGWRN